MTDDVMNEFDREFRRKLYDAELKAPGYVEQEVLKQLSAIPVQSKALKAANKWFVYVAAMAAVWTFVAVLFFHPENRNSLSPALTSVINDNERAGHSFVSAAKWFNGAVYNYNNISAQGAGYKKQSVTSESTLSNISTPTIVALSDHVKDSENYLIENTSLTSENNLTDQQVSFRLKIVENQNPDNTVYEEILTGKYELPVVFLEKEKARLLKDFPSGKLNRLN